MRRIILLTVAALLCVAPSANAGALDPVAGERLCVTNPEGVDIWCDGFPYGKYVYQDGTNFHEMPYQSKTIRTYYFENGASATVYLEAKTLAGAYTYSDYRKWGWVGSDPNVTDGAEVDPTRLASDGTTFKCPLFKNRGKRVGITSTSGVSCKVAKSVIARKVSKNSGWHCRTGVCVLSDYFEDIATFKFRNVKAGDVASDVKGNGMGIYCGSYNLVTAYYVYAHNCSDVDEAMVGSLAGYLSGEKPNPSCNYDNSIQLLRCSTKSGCTVISRRTVSKLPGFIPFGQKLMYMPRGECTRI